jgi:hypothetical protein
MVSTASNSNSGTIVHTCQAPLLRLLECCDACRVHRRLPCYILRAAVLGDVALHGQPVQVQHALRGAETSPTVQLSFMVEVYI